MSQTILIDRIQQCRGITAQLLTHKELAMDVEGVALCRTGQIGLIQLCTTGGDVWLFDIATLGQDAFEAGGLKRVLESESICKVIFDGRADADALYHRHWVSLRRAYDLQIHHALRYSSEGDRQGSRPTCQGRRQTHVCSRSWGPTGSLVGTSIASSVD
eukprot:Selendium_serpulae@DN4257_c0_g1_i2.p2